MRSAARQSRHAAKQQRHRARQREGMTNYDVDVHWRVLLEMVEAGYLLAEVASDRVLVSKAVSALLLDWVRTRQRMKQ